MDTRRRPVRRYSYGHKEKKETDIREKILLQCIISSVILATSLTVCFIKTDTTQNIKESLKTALSTEISKEDFLKQVDSLKSSVKDIFSDKDLIKPDINANSIEKVKESETLNENTENRIDEEILERINANTENYEKKNPIIDSSE